MILLRGLLIVALSQSAWAADGAALFRQHCAACHQETAIGTAGLAPALLGDHWQRLGAERSYLPTVVLKGLSGPIKLASGATFNGSMPAFAAAMNDEELAAVATHLRGLQGAGTDKPFAADEFAPLRAGPGNPALTRALRRKILGE